MKKNLILLLVVTFGFVKVIAQEVNTKFEVDGVQYVYDKENDMVVVGDNSYYEGTSDLVIPATVEYDGKEYPVKKIVEGAFFTCKKLTSVVIPNTIEEIGYKVFAGCI